jgi:methionyl-tRNA formyltransferase
VSEPRPLRVVYLGNDERSAPPLRALAGSRHDVALVLTRVPGPGRRGGPEVPSPVADLARSLGLPLLEVETVVSGSGFEALAGARPEVLAVVAYGEILPPRVLAVPSVAPVNVHFSLLPALRGASPVQAALLQGLPETGVSTMLMEAGLDTGGVLAQARVPIDPEDDAGSLGERLALVGGGLLVQTLDALSTGSIGPVPQEGSAATYAPKLGPADRRIDWSAPAGTIANLVRALAPRPCATSAFRGRPLKLYRARQVEGDGAPGAVIEVDRAGFAVAAGRGALRILELAPAGRSRMEASAFVNGFRPVPGERLS